MNEQQPYEKHLAEKLRQLPVPDVEPNWQQMKSLLDKEMPRGGGYWKWIAGVSIIILLIGALFYSDLSSTNSTPVVAKENSNNSKKQNTSADADKDLSQDKSTRDHNQNELPAQSQPPEGVNSSRHIAKNNTEEEKRLSVQPLKKPFTPNKESNEENLLISLNNKLPDNKHSADPKNNSSGIHGKDVAKNKTLQGSKDKNDFNANAQMSLPDASRNSPDLQKQSGEDPVKTTTLMNVQNTDLLHFNVKIGLGDSINLAYNSNKVIQPLVSLKKAARPSKSKVPYNSNNRNIAIGLSLPLGFPLGDQKPGAYNVNAGPNTISDYLPAPHVQYHINAKVYLQTELQLMSPQYIQPVLLYQNKREVPTTNTVLYNSAYAKKLYYFNIPLGIHYSPFQHFYLGTGLQFSSLVSGVAMHEEKRSLMSTGVSTSTSTHYAKFKNDSLSRKIDGSEFRLMLDANYYWNKFTVGLRYNQALSNYVSFRVTNSSPLFQDKNKSLQFYLRYNLWEDQKKRKKTSLAKGK